MQRCGDLGHMVTGEAFNGVMEGEDARGRHRNTPSKSFALCGWIPKSPFLTFQLNGFLDGCCIRGATKKRDATSYFILGKNNVL